MNIKISTNKTRYDKGQIFPFLIAIIVVIIITAMITVNLGQISVFRTDVSNAADAAALAGASTLSGYLLGFGLKSDTMCGKMVVCVAAIITELLLSAIPGVGLVTIPAAIGTYIAFIIGQLASYFQSLEEGKMAWSNAKKTALQYAFQNAGIDEPRPTFNQFLRGVYNITNPNSLSAESIRHYNRIYSLGDDPAANHNTRDRIRRFTESGFSRFMERGEYWDEDVWGEIRPGNMSPAVISSWYGWTVDGQTINYGWGYDNDRGHRNYDNYVKVQIIANLIYPLGLQNPISDVLGDFKDYLEDHLNLPWPFDGLVSWIISLFMGLIASFCPGGLQMSNGRPQDIIETTDKNPIIVTVERGKKNNDLGLWTFRYGITSAQAQSHVYGENDPDDIPHDIKPVLWGNLWSLILSAFSGDWAWEWFDTTKHLFESELMYTR